MQKILDGIRRNPYVVFLLIASPILLFPTVLVPLTGFVLLLVLLVEIGKWYKRGFVWPNSPITIPLALLVASVLLSLLWTTSPPDTFKKAVVFIFGFLVFKAVVSTCADMRSIIKAVVGFAIVSLLFMFLAIPAVQWQSKIPVVKRVIAILPGPYIQLPETASGYINPNQLAMLPMLYLPVSLSLVTVWPSLMGKRFLSGYRVILWITILGATLILVVSQSRTAWVAESVALGTYIFLRWLMSVSSTKRKVRFGVAVLIWALLVGISPFLSVFLAHALNAANFVERANLSSRLEIWGHSLEMFRYVPLTGIGLGAYRAVVPYILPFTTMSPTTGVFWNAHNSFLEVAVNLGVLGLVAYITFLGILSYEIVHLALYAEGEKALLFSGVAGSIISFYVYGFGNAVNLGAKPMVVVWMLFGVLHALYNLHLQTYSRLSPVSTFEWRRSFYVLTIGVAMLIGGWSIIHLPALVRTNNLTQRLLPQWKSVYVQDEIPRCAPAGHNNILLETEYPNVERETSVPLLTLYGWKAWAEGRCDRARDLWKRAVERRPQEVAAAWGLVWLGEQDWLYSEGALSPENIALYAYHRGLWAELDKKYAASINWYVYALNTYPALYQAAVRLDAIYQQQANHTRLEAMWRWLSTQLSKDEPGYWWAEGRLAELQGDFRKALNAYSRGAHLARDPAPFLYKKRLLSEKLNR